MGRHRVRAGGVVDAPIEVVWDMVANARGWSSWAMMTRSTLEREGVPAPDGVGAVRNFGSAGVMSREEVVVFDPPHHLGYVMLSGLPVRDYRADVVLSAEGPDRCSIEWTGGFEAGRVLGPVMQRLIGFFVSDFVRRIRKVAPTRR